MEIRNNFSICNLLKSSLCIAGELTDPTSIIFFKFLTDTIYLTWIYVSPYLHNIIGTYTYIPNLPLLKGKHADGSTLLKCPVLATWQSSV